LAPNSWAVSTSFSPSSGVSTAISFCSALSRLIFGAATISFHSAAT
jgi:hypothetical protein